MLFIEGLVGLVFVWFSEFDSRIKEFVLYMFHVKQFATLV